MSERVSTAAPEVRDPHSVTALTRGSARRDRRCAGQAAGLRLQVGRQAWYLRVEERQAEKGRYNPLVQEKSIELGPMSQNRFPTPHPDVNDALNGFRAQIEAIRETNSTKPSNT